MTLMNEIPKRKTKAAGQCIAALHSGSARPSEKSPRAGMHLPTSNGMHAGSDKSQGTDPRSFATPTRRVRPSEKGSQARPFVATAPSLPANPEITATSHGIDVAQPSIACRGSNKRKAIRGMSSDTPLPSAQPNATDRSTGDTQTSIVGRNGKRNQANSLFSSTDAVPASPTDDAKAEGLPASESRPGRAFPFARLMERQVQHRRMMRMRIRCENDGIAYAARMMGYSSTLTEGERSKFFDKARAIFESIRTGKSFESGLSPLHDLELKLYCGIAADVGTRYRAAESEIEREIESLAKQLPVAPFVDAIKGVTAKGLGHIIGETGDLSRYSGPAKVWKRLGLAPYNGKAGSTWRREGGLSADEWTVLGYVSSRRSVMYVVGDPMMKTNDGKYRAKYDARRAHTAVTHPDWTKGHSHLDGMRIMVKELVKDLWRAWRDLPASEVES